ncbi:2-oxo-4-hydroxy-4-carboxy-5-ureidoimidazoline decarboxylase-like [Branchiostoma floridae]|uniref:2-oxo-4-hydroxy-4-carboxy-5-ureidoimidazoline decarboxylase n=1 Tax=Branchiostoma floridae TaxID=7739 RepID=A0A9J7LF66_BRAFL|nr:2-oxo-4-hydroxy-4-carboxy-5-ureidoimidazoline decarboxylase-like [Branchiostoma floridae]
MASLTIAEVNKLDSEEFIEIFGNVVENCKLAAAAVWSHKPFQDVDHLNQTIADFLDALPQKGKEGVLRCHPDLAGRLAQAGQLTAESTQEQRSAGLDQLTQDELSTLTDLNQQYKVKFGFPFVICARLNKKAAILNGLTERLKHSAEEETLAGVEEVKKICQLRIVDIVTSEAKL